MLWDSQQLAIVEATRSPDHLFHLDAQEFMECGTLVLKRRPANRALPLGEYNASPMRAIPPLRWDAGAQGAAVAAGERSRWDDLPSFTFGDPQSAV